MLSIPLRGPMAALAILVFSVNLSAQSNTTSSNLLFPGEEKHLRNVRQLTFGGQNAEAYFSIDDKMLSFQHQGNGVACDQIYTMPVDTPDGKPATRMATSGQFTAATRSTRRSSTAATSSC